jgi:YfiH family protein
MKTSIHAIQSLALPVPHGFFTRWGGVSEGVFESLNGSFKSKDLHENVLTNRQRALDFLGLKKGYFLNQAHTNRCVLWPSSDADELVHADAVVTKEPGVALSLQTADCSPILFHGTSDSGSIVGAAHAGWRGACSGILEATLSCMIGLGANLSSIIAVLGPTIHSPHYPVGPEFPEIIQKTSPFSVTPFFTSDTEEIFTSSPSKPLPLDAVFFDLVGYIIHRLRGYGVPVVESVGIDTYTNTDFFSRRRTISQGHETFGRSISMIGIPLL